MIRRFSREILLLVTMLLLFVGCAEPPQPTSTPFVSVAATNDTTNPDYPVSNDASSGYIVPRDAVPPTPLPEQAVPQPAADQGVMTGRVFSIATGKPIVSSPVQLAEVIRQNGEGVFVLDGAQSPYAIIDVTGRFVFENLAPGEYFLVVGNVEGGTVQTGHYLIVEGEQNSGQSYFVEAGQITDIGDVSVAEITGYETTD